MPSVRPVRRLKPGFFVLGAALVALVAYFVFFGQSKPVAPKAPVTSVVIAQVRRADITQTVSALGQVVSTQSVIVAPQISGVLASVPVKEGGQVHKGEVLAQIVCDPYQAVLKQAQGALQRDQALLAAARLDLKRYETLSSQDSISRQQVDTQTALVKQEEGTVRIDEGAADAARVNVGYCQIRSPVDGRVSLRLVDPGNVVSPTSTAGGLFTVNTVSPIAVTFTVAQGDFGRLAAASNGFGRTLPVTALSQETGEPLATGRLAFVDNHVDPATGTVALKALFSNDDRRLLSGQFVTVKLAQASLKGALTIPVNAVNQGPKGSYAYVIDAAGKAQMRPIVTASIEDGTAIIAKGLSEGETVVLDGQMSLRPGAKVFIAKPRAPTDGKAAH